MLKKITLLIITSWLLNASSRADEGMWIPLLLDELNIQNMQEQGLRLSAEDIYSINQACIKDAVVIFGRGCTAEVISDQGLIITNHHCGIGQIQAHSTIDNDYLTNGFWAMSKEEELPNPGLTVSFLKRMEDVSARVLKGITGESTETERQATISKNIEEIKNEAVNGTHYKSDIKPFFYENEYYLFVYEEFRDIRLVGAPPSAVGKFGGDIDNWIWPRHTGDFSLFRIYADQDNNPAEYSMDNVPYKPVKHLPVSLKGLREGDFTMICGYPGSTYQYITSDALRILKEISLPNKIKVRSIRMGIMQKAMNSSDDVRIKYASKYARLTNSWKKWIGVINGLERVNAVEKKKILETEFIEWTRSDPERKEIYGTLFDDFHEKYGELEKLTLPYDYSNEIVMSIEMFSLISEFYLLVDEYGNKDEDPDGYSGTLENMKRYTESFYKDYHQPVDQKIFSYLLQVYFEDLPVDFHPESFSKVSRRYKGDFNKYAEVIYNKTLFMDQEKVKNVLNNFNRSAIRKIQNDPAYSLFNEFLGKLSLVYTLYNQFMEMLSSNYRLYVKGLIEMQKDRLFYPDANLTMRITYGKIKGYKPGDAVRYKCFTTLKGIMEKEDPEVYDYFVPEKLKELYVNKDYGRYSRNDTMFVCFVAGNHTSGGNSGSPVLNSEGHLVGINFDRNWEGTMSDYIYDPGQCRNIALDVRYALFIIDKFAGAKHLIGEMEIVE